MNKAVSLVDTHTQYHVQVVHPGKHGPPMLARTTGYNTLARVNALMEYTGCIVTLLDARYGLSKVLKLQPSARPKINVALCMSSDGTVFTAYCKWDYKFGLQMGE